MCVFIIISFLVGVKPPSIVYLGVNAGVNKWVDESEARYNLFAPDLSVSVSTPVEGVIFGLEGGITFPVCNYFREMKIHDLYVGVNEVIRKNSFYIGIGVHRHMLRVECLGEIAFPYPQKLIYEERVWGFKIQAGYIKDISEMWGIKCEVEYIHIDKFWEINVARPGVKVGILLKG